MIFREKFFIPAFDRRRKHVLAPRLTELSDERKSAKQALRLLQQGDLADKFDEYPDQLSGGQKATVNPRVSGGINRKFYYVMKSPPPSPIS